MCLGNVSKHFAVHNMKKTESNGNVHHLSVDYLSINTDNVKNSFSRNFKLHTERTCLICFLSKMVYIKDKVFLNA